MLAFIATSLLNIEDSIATPCSVKANGAYLVYSFLLSASFEVTICDLKLIFNELYSSVDNVNMKSSGTTLPDRSPASPSFHGSHGSGLESELIRPS